MAEVAFRSNPAASGDADLVVTDDPTDPVAADHFDADLLTADLLNADLLNDVRVPLIRRPSAVTAGLGAALVVTMAVAISVGRLSIPIEDVVRILLAAVGFSVEAPTGSRAEIVTNVRLPRVVLAAVIGSGLALSGAVLQGVFRNPLVSPQILGISSGASFGGALAILFGLGAGWILAGAFGMGMLALAVVFFTARVDGSASALMVVLAGTVASAMFTAFVNVLTYIADPQTVLPSIVYWLLGSFSSATWNDVSVTVLPVVLGCGICLALRWRINVLSLGDEDAAALGVKVQPLRWTLLTATAVITAACVAAVGVVGWVGLVIAHLARMWVGPDHRGLLPVTAMLGAVYLVAMDTAARTVTPGEVPIGVLTAVIGAPIFLHLLRRTRAQEWANG